MLLTGGELKCADRNQGTEKKRRELEGDEGLLGRIAYWTVSKKEEGKKASPSSTSCTPGLVVVSYGHAGCRAKREEGEKKKA